MAKSMTALTVPELNKVLARIPKEANKQLRSASKDIAADIAHDAQARARSVGGVASLVAPTIRATSDRVPVVRMGGTQSIRSGIHQTIGDVIMGAEFGGGARPTTQQFLPHRGTLGYFLWPTVRDRSDDTQARYSVALDNALQKV